ncbi:GNAT family N-acetyltransferase [Marinicella sp. W31]|uniref:GNAT family N-acetyltransferase n=1 Tax=Marinicella sp. W31 TaxID=3023713 RepID=UPI003756A6B4
MIETQRLILTELEDADTGFVFSLYTDPTFIKGVGDKGIKNTEDANRYLHENLIGHYRAHGFGLWKVTLKSNQQAQGICGLVQRQSLLYPDVGFGFLKSAQRQGFGTESATAVLDYAQHQLGLSQVLGITSEENQGSQKLLEKIGLRRQPNVVMPEYGKESVVMFALKNDTVVLKS